MSDLLITYRSTASQFITGYSHNLTFKIQSLPVAFDGFETSCVTLREELGLRMFQKGVLRKIFEPHRG